MGMTKEDENYIEEMLIKIDSALDRIGKELKETDKSFDKMHQYLSEATKELQMQNIYFQKGNVGRPLDMPPHDCEMTYQ